MAYIDIAKDLLWYKEESANICRMLGNSKKHFVVEVHSKAEGIYE